MKKNPPTHLRKTENRKRIIYFGLGCCRCKFICNGDENYPERTCNYTPGHEKVRKKQKHRDHYLVLDETVGTNLVLNLKIDAALLVVERRYLSTHSEHSQPSAFLVSEREEARR